MTIAHSSHPRCIAEVTPNVAPCGSPSRPWRDYCREEHSQHKQQDCAAAIVAARYQTPYIYTINVDAHNNMLSPVECLVTASPVVSLIITDRVPSVGTASSDDKLRTGPMCPL